MPARNTEVPAPASTVPTAADALLASLWRHGFDRFFANPGTDFPPIIEAFARAKAAGRRVPQPVLVPHENLAVAMAHGAYLITGAPQVLMVHVNVGTANTINLLANASRDRVPLLLLAGRSPIMERAHSERAAGRSTGRRRCSTRPAWCANLSSGNTSCAIPRRPQTSSRAPWKRP
jgi:hypothetical protein